MNHNTALRKAPTITVRDLFWAVLVVGIGLAWWLDRSALWRRADWLWDAFIESHERDEHWQRATGVANPGDVDAARLKKWQIDQQWGKTKGTKGDGKDFNVLTPGKN